MARTKVSAKKSTAGKSASKGAGPKAVPIKTLGTKRRRPQEEDEEKGEEEENEVMSEDEQREEEPKKLAAPARRCVQILQEDPDEAAEGSLDDEIVEIWENKMQPHMTQSQVSGLSAPSADNQGLVRLANKIQSVSERELLGYINKRTAMEGDLVQLLRAIFQGLPSYTDKGKQIRGAVLHRVMWLIIKGRLTNKKAEEAVNALLPEMDAVADEDFIDLAEVILWGVEKARSAEGRFLDFLPKTLAAIERLSAVGVDEHTNKTGPQYKSHLIARLCDLDWSEELVRQITATLREITLSHDEMQRVIHKIISFFKGIDLNELPSLIYQLILLATKGATDVKASLLRGIANHLESEGRKYDEESPDKRTAASGDEQLLRHIEGTVLLHLQFAIKQDQELGRAFLKVFKSENFPLTSFTVALLLSVARIQRFADQALDTIKTAIQTYYKEQQKKSKSHWMEKMRQHMPPTINLDAAILATIKHSAYGWDHITPSLVQLGVMLMDSVSASSPASSVASASAASTASAAGTTSTPTASSSIISVSTPNKMLLRLGVRILLEIFKVHESVRNEILEQILSRVMISGENSNVLQYIILLSSISRECQDLLLGSGGEYLPRIKEVFDYLSYVPPTVTRALLAAVEPIMAINPSFQDHIILVLRKAMFSRELESRLTAVTGFEHLLKSCARKKNKHEAQKAELFSLEMIGFLRRCLSQQWEIRARLYDALTEVFKSSHSLAVKEAILELLLQHFMHFLETDPSVSAPIKLDKCVEVSQTSAATVKRLEPLGNLINAIQRCVMDYKLAMVKRQSSPDHTPSDPLPVFEELQASLDSLVEKLLKTELEDFSLDKSADYSDTSCEGRFHQEAALVLLSTFEVLIDYSVMREMPEPPSADSLKVAIDLFTHYETLQMVVKDATAKKAKGGAKGGAKDKAKDTIVASGSSGSQKGKGKGKEKDLDDVGDEAEAKPKKAARGRGRPGAGAPKRHKLVEGAFLELNCVLGLIKLLVEEVEDSSQSGDANAVQRLIRANQAFQSYFFTAAHNMLNSWNEEVQEGVGLELGDGRSSLLRSRAKFCSEASSYILQEFVSAHLSADSKNKKIAQVQLECLEQSLRFLVTQWGPRKVALLLKESLLPHLANYQDVEAEVPEAEEDQPPLEAEAIIHNTLVRFEAIMLQLAKSKRYKEAEVFKDIIELLFEFLRSPGSVKELVPVHAKLMNIACGETAIENAAAAKSMVSLFLKIARSLPKMNILNALAVDVHVLLGHVTEEDPSNQARRYPLINKATVSQILPLITSTIDSSLDEVEQVLVISKSMYLEDKEQDQQYDESEDEGEDKTAGLTARARLLMSECCKQLHLLLKVLSSIVTSAIPLLCAEGLVKALVHLYKILSQLSKTAMQLQLRPSETFQELVKHSGRDFTPTIYELLAYIEKPQDMEDEHVDKAERLTKAKLKRLATLLPNLIFLIEQFESVLIRYGKKFKVNLVEGFRRSTTRDFRIASSNLKKQDDMPPPPPKKKTKTTQPNAAAATSAPTTKAPARAAGLKRKGPASDDAQAATAKSTATSSKKKKSD